MTDVNIAFIGLGIMGSKMAARLVKADCRLMVYDINKSAVEKLEKQGALKAGSVSQAAAYGDVVITMLPDAPQVEDVIMKDGLLEHMRPGGILVDMSTTAASAPKRFANLLAGKNIGFVDAPVTGGEAAAGNGTLSIFAGGKDEDIERVMPILKLMGGKITPMGGVGMGQTAKTCNQIVGALTLQAVCEGLILAAKSNMDIKKLADAMKGGASDSFMLDYVSERVLREDFAPGFKIFLEQKDLRNALAAADETNTPLPALALVNQLFRAREAAGGEQTEGNQALYLVYEQLAGING